MENPVVKLNLNYLASHMCVSFLNPLRLIWVALACNVFFLCGPEALANDPLFRIQPYARSWLHYYHFTVPFDSSRTTYLFGEIKLIQGSNTHLINFANFIAPGSTVYAGPERGDNPELARVCRSASFVIPDCQISFFRRFSNENNSSGYPDTSTRKYLGWHITDTTFFRVLLVRDSDEQVLQTLDSIGTFAKLSYQQGDTRFGTDPQHVIRTVSLSQVNVGTLAHLEILPSWYGADDFTNSGCNCCPTVIRDINWSAHGMAATRFEHEVNCSALFDPYGRYVVTDSMNSAWSNQKYAQLVSWEDSIIAATGCKGFPTPLGFDSAAQVTRFNLHFGQIPDTLRSGNIAWHSTGCTRQMSFGKSSGVGTSQLITAGRFGTVVAASNPINLQVTPNPSNGNTSFVFEVPVEDAQEVATVRVFNMLVQDVSTLVNEIKPAGRHIVRFDGSRLPAGRYIVAVHLKNHQQSKLIILTR